MVFQVEYDERGRMGDWGRHQIVHEEGARRLLGTFSAFTPLAVGDPYDEKKPTANGRVRGKQLIAYKFNGAFSNQPPHEVPADSAPPSFDLLAF